jgi:hypothetical protein
MRNLDAFARRDDFLGFVVISPNTQLYRELLWIIILCGLGAGGLRAALTNDMRIMTIGGDGWIFGMIVPRL